MAFNTQQLIPYGWNDRVDRLYDQVGNGPGTPARILASHAGGSFKAFTPDGFRLLTPCGSLRYRASRGASTFPVVGDWVVAEKGKITAVAPRFSAYRRKAPGSALEEQVLFANADCLLVVTGLDRDYNPKRLERFLSLAAGMDKAVVLTKADLHAEPGQLQERARAEVPGTEVYLVSGATGRGLENLQALLRPGLTIALLGSSGCGKTTLINALIRNTDPGWRDLDTREVRETDGRGRHTTTTRSLLPHPCGALLMDNPGMREVQLWSDEDRPNEGFADIIDLASRCKFGDCKHQGEPGCAVQAAVLEGGLAQERFLNYLKLHDELARVNRRRREKSRQPGGAPRYRRQPGIRGAYDQ